MNRKKFLLIAAVLVLGIAAFWIYQSRSARKDNAPQLATEVATVKDVEETVLAQGKLEPKDLISVGAQVSGQLKVLSVKVGQHVKAGQLIAEIDAQPQQLAMVNAELAIANVKAQRASRVAQQQLAQVAYDRQSKMLASGAVSKSDLDTARATLDSANADIAAFDAQIKQATTQLDTARINMGYTRIVAPIDGVVVAVVTKQGQTVNSMQSAPTIVMLANLDTMTVKAQVSEADVVKVKTGQTVYFTTLGDPDRRYYGTVSQIEPAPESISSSTTTGSSSSTSSSAIYYNAIFNVPNTDSSLYTSMTAQVSIVIASAKGALTIPSSALGTRDPSGSYAVQVVDDKGRASPRSVHIGINTKVVAQVLDGLKAGDKIVVGEVTKGSQNQMDPMGMGFF